LGKLVAQSANNIFAKPGFITSAKKKLNLRRLPMVANLLGLTFGLIEVQPNVPRHVRMDLFYF